MKKIDHETCEIYHVSMWDNGIVVCFCAHQRVIDSLSGKQEEVIPKIRKVYRGVINKAFFVDAPQGKVLTYEPMLD